MKKVVFLIVILALLVSTNIYAQKANKADKETVVIQTSAQCEMCKASIEKELAYTKGVKKAKLNIDDKKVTVTFYKSKTNVNELRQAISKIGYDADEVKAEENAYAKLSPCCKKK